MARLDSFSSSLVIIVDGVGVFGVAALGVACFGFFLELGVVDMGDTHTAT